MKAKDLTCSYGQVLAVDGFSFDVAEYKVRIAELERLLGQKEVEIPL